MHCVAGKRHMFVCNETGIKRNGVKTVCDQLVWIMITEWNGSMISIALIHAPTLTSCNGTPWINMGFLHTIIWGFWKLCPLRYSQTSLLNNECGIDFSLWKITSSQNSILLHSMHCGACEWQLCYVDESEAFLLHFLVEPLTQLFAVQVAPETFWTYLQCGSNFVT